MSWRLLPAAPEVERTRTLATLAAAGITEAPRMGGRWRPGRPVASIEGWAESLLTRRQIADGQSAERREYLIESAAAFGIDLDVPDRQPVRLAYLEPDSPERTLGEWVDRQYAYGRLADGYYLAEILDWTPTRRVELLDLAGVAVRLGVAYASVRRYRSQDPTFPEPDVVLGSAPGWRPETIDAWQAGRAGQGVGGGRPRKPSDAE